MIFAWPSIMEKAGFPRMAYGSIVLDLNLFYFAAFNIWFSGLLHCQKKKKKNSNQDYQHYIPEFRLNLQVCLKNLFTSEKLMSSFSICVEEIKWVLYTKIEKKEQAPPHPLKRLFFNQFFYILFIGEYLELN